MNDKKLFKYAALLILAPLTLAIFGGDRFRYACQDPANWDKAECQKPVCEVTRTCPEHVFKGQDNVPSEQALVKEIPSSKPIVSGANCK